MKIFFVCLVFFLFIFLYPANKNTPHNQKTAQSKDTVTTFQENVLPMLQANCKPCHFYGGKMYSKLPFDDSTIVLKLGKKLFTRLQKKEQQEIINRWIGAEEKK